ncbi:reverse transcriptase [Phytophthora megakarya]|uniref:Reverse transcriptase n=1 Tax=Phytophthora megakarya TaxID=4795 RepID=A0A225UTZ9_9STRA|nr:reverse transcriptase [Phytophthora megakarya]
MFGSIAMNYEVDQQDLLFYCPTTKETAANRDKLMRLVIPETLQQDVLHHYHTSLQGGHQGVGRTYDRIRDHFHWRGLHKRVHTWENASTVKQAKEDLGSRASHMATYPFQVIAMDHIPSLPRSFNGNTELLIFVDLFLGYVIAKASASRSAQTIAETYEECVFRANGLLWRIDPKLMDLQNVWSRQLPGLLRCTWKIWINEIGTSMRNDSLSRSTPQEIGSEVKRLSI